MDSQAAVRVLLVEDSEDNRIVYVTILTHFGCIVEIAVDGQEGIDKARSWLPEVILMDINLPKISGWDATKILKKDPLTQGIPIIALTALGSPEDILTSQKCGCITHLTKPCPPRTVMSEVWRVCGREDVSSPVLMA